MPQSILKERTAHLARYTFLQEMQININFALYTSLSQLYQLPRTPFSQKTYQQLLSFSEYRKSFANFTLLFKTLSDWRLATLLKKRLQRRCFSVKCAKFLRTDFFIKHFRKQSFADVFQKIGAHKSFANFTSLFKKLAD